MIGVVLAAGAGTRMRPLSLERPKALIPTLGVPQLAWVLARIRIAEIERAWINAHFFIDQMESRVRSISDEFDMELLISHESDRPLGTAGALRKLADDLGETFVVISADVATNFPVDRLIEAHKSSGASATLLGIPTESDADFLTEEGWVVDLVDRRNAVRPGHLYGNLGVFEPEVLAYIPDGATGLYETVFTGLTRDGRGVAAVEWDGYWLNIGSPSEHLDANLDALSGLLSSQDIDPILDGAMRRDATAFVGAGAEVEGAELRHAIVGAGAKIASRARLERCVVWEGAEVVAGEYRDAIITPTQVVSAR